MSSSFNYGTESTTYSSVIIFSYPNTTDIMFKIDDYLFNNDSLKIDELFIELNGEFIMENNIFGYNYSGVEIIDNCNGLTDIYLAMLNNTKIDSFYFLEKNKKIKLIIPKSTVYNAFTCKFRYACKVSEPEYEEFNKYPGEIIHSGGTNEEKLHFDAQKTNYLGKYSYYTLYQENQLITENCGEKCELCYSSDQSCITCQDSSNILNKKKICVDKPTKISSEIQTTNVQISTEIKFSDIEILSSDIKLSSSNIEISNSNKEILSSNIKTSSSNIEISTSDIKSSYSNIEITSSDIRESSSELEISSINIKPSSSYKNYHLHI